MNIPTNEELVEKEYHVSWFIVAYKFIFGFLEFALGAGIAFFGKNVLSLYRLYSSQELAEDPHDLIVRLSQHVVPNVLTHDSFLVIYLILLGVVKMVGAVGLLYKKTWGIDVLVAVTLIMFPFQFIQLIRRPSFVDFLYVFIGVAIALYLINFKPRTWARKMIKHIGKGR